MKRTITTQCEGCGKLITFDYGWFMKNVSLTSIIHCSDECLAKVIHEAYAGYDILPKKGEQ